MFSYQQKTIINYKIIAYEFDRMCYLIPICIYVIPHIVLCQEDRGVTLMMI